MLEEPHVMLYIFVDWSIYAAKIGLNIVEEVEAHFTATANESRVSFWLADVSDSNSPAFFTADWLRQEQERTELRLFPAIGIGNGSVVWINHGSVVDFALSASHLKRSGVIEKTESLFSAGAHYGPED
jgi:hypothetical protein